MNSKTCCSWKHYFDEIAPVYEDVILSRNTIAEVDFIEEELKLTSGASVLDLGCGTGRHSIELARRGYQLTGVDISPGMLAVARQNAEKAGVSINFVESPAQDFSTDQRFDAAISLCEGALCLFADDDNIWGKDMAIFGSMSELLLPGKPFLITVLNAFRLIRSISENELAAGIVDLFTLTSRFNTETIVDGGKISLQGIKRYYTPSEIVRMVNRVGLKVDKVYGGTAENSQRGPVQLDETEFMVVGHRKT